MTTESTGFPSPAGAPRSAGQTTGRVTIAAPPRERARDHTPRGFEPFDRLAAPARVRRPARRTLPTRRTAIAASTPATSAASSGSVRR
ncbi:hypothetical protein, partial [Streptomyces montanisoli]